MIAGTLSVLVNAQSSFQVTELATGNTANHHYVFNTDTSNHNAPTELIEFKITNTSSSTKIAKIKKNILINGTGHDIYFCFNTACYTPFVYYSNATILAGQSLPSGSGSYGLRTEFDANMSIASSIVRYTIYDSTNVTDSMNITISYNMTNGLNDIKNISKTAFISSLYPNPASNVVNLNYDLGSINTEASVKIYNALGTLVKTVSLNPGLKNIQLEVSGLEEGFYVYSVVANGKTVSTKRLIIAR